MQNYFSVAARSIASAVAQSSSSPPMGPTSCRLTGTGKPGAGTGMAIAGTPARLTGAVSRVSGKPAKSVTSGGGATSVGSARTSTSANAAATSACHLARADLASANRSALTARPARRPSLTKVPTPVASSSVGCARHSSPTTMVPKASWVASHPGQPHLPNGAPGGAERSIDDVLDPGIDAVHAQPADDAGGTRGDREARLDQAHSGDDAGDVARQWADSVQTGRQRPDPGGRYSPPRRLQSDD